MADTPPQPEKATPCSSRPIYPGKQCKFTTLTGKKKKKVVDRKCPKQYRTPGGCFYCDGIVFCSILFLILLGSVAWHPRGACQNIRHLSVSSSLTDHLDLDRLSLCNQHCSPSSTYMVLPLLQTAFHTRQNSTSPHICDIRCQDCPVGVLHGWVFDRALLCGGLLFPDCQ